MSGCINEVNSAVLPEAGCCGGGDCHAAFAFLHHPIHLGGAVINRADFMLFAGIEENPFGCRRLAGIDMRRNPNISYFARRSFSVSVHKHLSVSVVDVLHD